MDPTEHGQGCLVHPKVPSTWHRAGPSRSCVMLAEFSHCVDPTITCSGQRETLGCRWTQRHPARPRPASFLELRSLATGSAGH